MQKKIKVTVSFPDTDSSVIQADNWLAGGMFATGYDNNLNQIDYGFYMILTLEHDGSLYLDFGINQTYECLFPYLPGSYPWTVGLFDATLPIMGVPPSTPITLTALWDIPHQGYVSWEYTVNEVNYLAGIVNVTALAPTIQPYFYVGSRNLDQTLFVPWIYYWQTYLFQFGIISRYNIGHGGWNVLLSDPSYFKDDEWHNVETARSVGGLNAFIDYRWMWGGQNYEGVSTDYFPSLEPRNVKFHYSGSTIGDNTPLWGIPVAPPDSMSAYEGPNSDEETCVYLNSQKGIYELFVGSKYYYGMDSYINATYFKNFIPKHTITHPKITFGFFDRGQMRTLGSDSYAILNASLRLLHNGNKLSEFSQPVHTANGTIYVGINFTNCFHEISTTYYGELLEGNTYTIEYGFSAFEHDAYIDLAADKVLGGHPPYGILAVWLIRADNYKLTINSRSTDGYEIRNVDVWVDDILVSPSPVIVTVSEGIHTIKVEGFLDRGIYWYYFDHWQDGVRNNPRSVNVISNATFTAYYQRVSCPTLFVWNGTDYAYETLLDIHAESDITLQHNITQPLVRDGFFYKLSLRELDEFTSHIDQVKLYAVDTSGQTHICLLASAIHSQQGRVTVQLLLNDEIRIDLDPTETIDLKFAPPLTNPNNIAHFTLEINGHNKKID